MGNETNVNNGEVKELNAKTWFEDNVNDENKESLLAIGALTKKFLADQFSLGLNSAETPLAIFASVYKTIIDELKLRRSSEREFKINIANTLEIGYDSPLNEEDTEKVGNFAPTLRHLGYSKLVDTTEDENENDDYVTSMAVGIATKWNALNTFEDLEIIRSIEQKSLSRLINDTGIHLGSIELPIPIFITVYEGMISYLKITMSDLKKDQMEIDVMGLFRLRVAIDDEGHYKVTMSPGIYTKMALKDDAKSYDLYQESDC